MARPQKYTDTTRVFLHSEKARNNLQQGSERRAIVNLIVEKGGSMTFKELDDHFGYDVRPQVAGLIRSNWLKDNTAEAR